MPHEARDLDLVLAKTMAVDAHARPRTAHAAASSAIEAPRPPSSVGNVRAQEAFLAQRVDGFVGKAAFAIDRISRWCGDRLGNDACGVCHSPSRDCQHHALVPISSDRPE